MKNYLIRKTDNNIQADITLNSSKSESNRVLIIQALSNEHFEINNISKSDDTKTLIALLNSGDEVLDAGPAGTTLRFLISYLAVKNNSIKTLTGSERMLERPVKDLVKALRELGADIEYLNKDGYPPLKITGKSFNKNEVNISGSTSSQYISSLMLIAPTLKNGLKINILNKIASKPYIDMTLKLLNYFGVEARWENNSIAIPNQKYISKNYMIEGDWSSASYLYEILALSNTGEIIIRGLKQDSLQGDSVIADIMVNFGIKTEYFSDYIKITKTDKITDSFEYDFSNCPDIAQTVAVTCATLNINAKLTGLESLKIKETDRVQALITELSKLGVNISETAENTLTIIKRDSENFNFESDILINTYKDHRMAMSFGPFSRIKEIKIEDIDVVNKSYPDYWKDLKKFGLAFTEIDI